MFNKPLFCLFSLNINNVKASNWIDDGNNRYYYIRDEKIYGFQEIDGYTYYFDLVSGESTFMVEMKEANTAMQEADQNSLIL